MAKWAESSTFSSQISGISAPIITGYLVTAFHSYAWAFGVAGVYLAIGITAYIFMLGKIERSPDGRRDMLDEGAS